MGRKAKPLPHGFQVREVVRITSQAFRGAEVGLISGACKYDNGILVWVVGKGENESIYYCIDPDKPGETITRVEKSNDGPISSS